MRERFVLALDDLLNDFSEMLFTCGMGHYNRNDPVLRQFLYDIKNGRPTDSGRRIMDTAHADTAGLQFFKWLTLNGFSVIICTDRDLRFAYRETAEWLKKYGIGHNGLFAADDPVEFCQKVHARYFLFGLPNQDELTPTQLKLFTFTAAGSDGSTDFANFEDVKRWIQKSDS